VALTIDQVEDFGLTPSMDEGFVGRTIFLGVDKYGDRLRELLSLSEDDPIPAFELEAMDPGDLANQLHDGIIDVLDIDLYNQELEAEEKDSAQIIAVQQQVAEFFKTLKL
jgi:hypothetical protein